MTSRVKKPNKTQVRYADKYIAMLEGFKKGKQIERKTRESDWHDYDLALFLSNNAVQYRIKK